MQPTLKASAGPQRAGPKPSKLPPTQRGCVIARSCPSTHEPPSWREQQAVAVASVLTSAIISVASASPAFAEEAVEAPLTIVPDQIDVVSPVVLDGPAVVAAPALEVVAPVAQSLEVAEVAEAPEVAVAETLTQVAEVEVPAVEAAAPTDVVSEVEVEVVQEAPAAAVEAAQEELVAVEAEAEAEAAAGPAGNVDAVAVEQTAAVVEEAVEAEGAQAVEVPVIAAAEEPEAAAAALVEATPASTLDDVVAAEAPTEAEAAIITSEDAPAPAPAADVPEPIPVEPVTAAAAAAVEQLEQPAAPGPAPEPLEAVEATAAAASAVVEEPVLSGVPVEAPAPVVVVEALAPVVPEEAPAAAAAAAAAGAAPSLDFDLPALLAGLTAGLTPASSSGEGPSAETLTYGTLGAVAASFIGTFFVAPRFRDAFKEPVDWRDMYSALSAKGVKTVTPEEAYGKAKKGAILLDVRLADKYAVRSAVPSVNAPIYRPIAGWDLASNIRRAGFAFFGIFGTELNPDFLAEAAAKVTRNKEVIVMCETGGTLDNKPGTQFGFQSRSLKAVYYLQQAGYGKVLHMKGGLGEWQRAGLPLSDAPEGLAPPPGRRNGTVSGSGTVNGSGTASGSSRRGTVAGTGRGGTSSSKATSRELVSVSSRGASGRK